MSRKWINVGVRLRLGRLDGRAELLSSVRRGHALYVGFYLFNWMLIWLLIWLTKDSDGFRPTLLLFIASLLLIVSATGFYTLNSRVNTLIELLRQEGILEGILPTSREAKPEDNSPGTRNESRPS